MSADGGRRAVPRPRWQTTTVYCRGTPVSPRWRRGLDHHPDSRRTAVDALSIADRRRAKRAKRFFAARFPRRNCHLHTFRRAEFRLAKEQGICRLVNGMRASLRASRCRRKHLHKGPKIRRRRETRPRLWRAASTPPCYRYSHTQTALRVCDNPYIHAKFELLDCFSTY